MLLPAQILTKKQGLFDNNPGLRFYGGYVNKM